MKTAVISGARGQDASYLSELLLDKGYKVVGIERRSSSPDYSNIQHIMNHENFVLEQGDITDFGSITRILKDHQPDEFYNLAAQSFVGAAWDQAIATCEINFVGTCNCLESIRLVSPKTKFFQASTSEVYGDVVEDIQDEDTLPRPQSPYAAAKFGAESLIRVYRESYGMFTCFARSFNHESPRRGKQFVTRKITSAIGDIITKVDSHVDKYLSKNFTPWEEGCKFLLNKGVIQPIRLGNLDAKRDWSHAKDMVRGFYLMLQQDKPDDFVFASGETRSVREFLNTAFRMVDIKDWEPFVTIDPKFYRPAEVNLLCGDYRKAKEILGWEPKIKFSELVEEMVLNDVKSPKFNPLTRATIFQMEYGNVQSTA
jgi:GDPmannose 4,6-dehydratase